MRGDWRLCQARSFPQHLCLFAPARAFCSALSTSSAMASTALAIPGVAVLAAVPANAGRDKLDPRFVAMLSQAEVPEAIWDALGDKKVTSAALFATSSGALASSITLPE